MKKFIFGLLFFLFLFILVSTNNALAQSSASELKPEENYYKAEVTKIIKTENMGEGELGNFTQTLEIKFLDGPLEGEVREAENSGTIKFAEEKKVNEGEKIVVLEVIQGERINYSVWDKYRLDLIFFIVIGFFTLVIIFAGLKGLGSIIGMITSFIILVGFIVPQILNGYNPLLITILGSSVILLVTIFLAHGVSKKTGVALSSTVIALTITGVLAYTIVKLMNLTGLGNEESYMLQIGNVDINAQGLLLSGIIIGTLGVLDDVTTTQSAAIFEFLKIDKKLSVTDLFVKGYVVGKDHIASLVNTLILAYAGASLALFVIFVLNPNNIPSWVMLNDEMITEEIVRAVVGSIGLIMAVPISTVIASIVAKKSST
jgi:uncharacterized membrane protein